MTPREAAAVVVGELPVLPHLVELPARGVGADIIGRAGGMLVDIAIDTVPRGYRIVARPGAVARRAAALLDEDLDALEEAWERAGLRGSARTVKVTAPGPVTLAAELELAGGHRALTDAGAVRDLAASLAEGVALLRAQVARRLEVSVVVQFDEPSLPAALAGRLSGVTGVSPVHPIDEPVAGGLLDDCVARIAADDGGPVALHCCAPGLPWAMLARTSLAAVGVDAATLGADDLDGIGALVDDGRTVVLGLVPSAAPATRPSAQQAAQAAASVTDRLGFPRAVLRDRIGVTTACGLAGATAAWARTATTLVAQVAEAFADDPEAV